MLKTKELLDLSKTIAAPLLEDKEYPWEALEGIADFIRALGPTLPADRFDHPSEDVWIAKDAKIFATAYIGSPCIIDEGAEIRQCAFIRGSAIVGKKAVVPCWGGSAVRVIWKLPGTRSWILSPAIAAEGKWALVLR